MIKLTERPAPGATTPYVPPQRLPLPQAGYDHLVEATIARRREGDIEGAMRMLGLAFDALDNQQLAQWEEAVSE